MKYCVIIELTRSLIKFRYQIDNGQVEFLALKDSEQEIPLAFYLNGDELLMGKYAVERASCGDPFAFTDYFELIKDPQKSFKFANEQRPIKQLLYLGVERYLSFFLREKLLAQDSSIDANRPKFPLRISFGLDISSNERRFVLEQFILAGYCNVAEVETEPSLFEIVSPNIKDKLMLTGVNGNLVMSYYNMRSRRFEQTRTLTGMGVDPRYKRCAEKILGYIMDLNPFLTETLDGNVDVLMAESKKILSSESTIMTGSVFLSCGREYEYEINRLELNNVISRAGENQNVLSEVEYFLGTLGANQSSIDIILVADANTDYFLKQLNEKYPVVFGVSEAQYFQMWKRVFSTVDLNPPAIQSPTIKIPDLPGGNVGGSSTNRPPDLPGGSSGGKKTFGPPGLPDNKNVSQGPPPVPGGKGVPSKVSPPPPPKSVAPPPPPKSVAPPPPPRSVAPSQPKPTPPPPSAPKKQGKGFAQKLLDNVVESGKKGLGGVNEKVKNAGVTGGVLASIKSMAATLNDKVIVVGRAGEQAMAITQSSVDREHCTLKPLRNGKVEVEDLSSCGGTFVNGVRINKAVVSLDDEIRLGPVFKAKVRDLLVKKK